MRCIYCNNPTYLLKNGYRKCKICKKKFSPFKIIKKNIILECFCKNYTANRCAKTNNVSYLSVIKEYQYIRKKILIFMDYEFNNKNSIIAFDEYFYFPYTKEKNIKNIFDASNFLTFNFDNKIYNILLPSLKKFKPLLIEDKIYKNHYYEFEKFLLSSHISTTFKNSLIKRFWSYFEEYILKYHGINNQNFIYYLKEAEFKFSYSCKRLKEFMTQERQD